MRTSRLFTLPLFATLALSLAVACGGGEEKPSAVGDGAGEKPAAARSSGPAASGGSGSAASQVLDLQGSAARLQELRSFHFDMTLKMSFEGIELDSGGDEEDALGSMFAGALLGALGDIKVQGSFVAPDAADLQLTLAGQKASFIQIGDKAWMKYGSEWQEMDLESADGFGFGGFTGSPTEVFGDFLPDDVLEGAKTTREKVNGVQTTHYAFDKDSLEQLAAKLGEDAGDLAELTSMDLDVWVTDDNIPVKLELSVAGADEDGNRMSMAMTFNIRDINDASIKVKPPA